MLSEQTIRKLNELRLYKMAETLRKLEKDDEYVDLPFDDKLGLIIDAEWLNRQNKRITRLNHAAKLSIPDACIENVRFDPERHINKSQILKLSLCHYVEQHQNVIILGATGTGKSYLSCALGHSAISNFYSVKYIRLPELFTELEEAKDKGTYRKVVKNYINVKLLIIDEWLTFPISTENARDVFEIINARYNKASTIFCSQFEMDGWFQKIGEAIYADSICDRIIHNAHKIKLEGESMRKLLGSITEESE